MKYLRYFSRKYETFSLYFTLHTGHRSTGIERISSLLLPKKHAMKLSSIRNKNVLM